MRKNVKYIRKIGIFLLILILIFIPIQTFALVSVTGGYVGINDYSKCTYGSRAGANYITELDEILHVASANPGITYSRSYSYTNSAAKKTSVMNANRVTLFAYAGHGLNYDASKNALHFNQPASGSAISHINYRLEEKEPSINLYTTEISFPHKYVILYTCNQLVDGGSTTKKQNILKMMNGTRLMLGFATTMYLDSREGRYFGSMLGEKTIANAYIIAAERYQPQRSAGSTTIARVAGYRSATNDRLNSSYSYAPSYTSSPSSFDNLKSVSISCNGNKI